jgi:23S rRNA (uracil1939-C5)-methyltransferase
MARPRGRLTVPPETGTVADLTHDGEGVVRGGKAAFIPGALPGETVHFRRTRAHRGHDEAVLLDVVEASPDRVEPPCRHFGTCGGCSLQHLAPDAQRAVKDRQLREALQRVGEVEPAAWFAPLAGPEVGYRRRARLGARFVHGKARALVGFRERLSSFVASLERCEVLVPEVGSLLVPLSDLVGALSIRLRLPQIEVAVGDDTIALVLRVLDPPTVEDRERLLAFERTHGVRLLLQAGAPDALETLDGAPPRLWYGLPDFDVKLDFLPSDFIQVNGEMNRRLVSRVVELLDLGPESRVLDLFCGLGNFTLPMARRAAHVVGIEGDAGLVERARGNARANGIVNATFAAANLAGDEAGAACLRLAATGGPYSHVLLDPPRTGARDVLAAVARLAPSRIVYVSCHPGSLARDLGILVREQGYRLDGAGIVDMFPHTSHVESVAVLSRPGGS